MRKQLKKLLILLPVLVLASLQNIFASMDMTSSLPMGHAQLISI